MVYRYLLKPLLFLLPAETAHGFATTSLKFFLRIPGFRFLMRKIFILENEKLNRTLLGLRFSNPVGMAAGFDKDAAHISGLNCLGFGFIEIGTLTPKPQPGNTRPRLFRIKRDKALINRMGFNNQGVENAVKYLKNRPPGLIVGGNIGKNKITPNEEAWKDYLSALNSLYPYVDYFTINLSSPNTPGLRELQDKAPLKNLLNILQTEIQGKSQKKPLLLKIAPDLNPGQLDDIIEIARELNLDGLVATNTTLDRSMLQTTLSKLETIGQGGLSGAPLKPKTIFMIRYLREKLGKSIAIIGVGGIMNPSDAVEMLRAGADLVQVYTGFIYNGPGFIKNINRKILTEFEQNS